MPLSTMELKKQGLSASESVKGIFNNLKKVGSLLTSYRAKLRFGDNHNVMMANKTAVVTSPTKISIDHEKLAKRSNLQLRDLPCLSDGTRVSCTVKVLRVEAKALVSGGQSQTRLWPTR